MTKWQDFIFFLTRSSPVIVFFCFMPTITLAQTTFQNVTSNANIDDVGTISVAWFDYNNDEQLDLYITAYPGPQPGSLLFVQNQNTFSNMTDFTNVNTQNGNGVAIGDYNNDGNLDLYLTRFSITNLLFQNRGDGTFTNETNRAGVAAIGSDLLRSGASFADYNNDGLLDLFVGNASGSDILYQNQGDGTFVDVTAQANLNAPRATPHHQFADFNNDGFMDLYVPNNFDIVPAFSQVTDALYLNNGNGTFTDITTQAGINHPSASPEGVLVLDYNNDSFFDIFLTSSRNTQRNLLYQNNGNSTFTEVGGQAGIRETSVSVGLTAGDFDNNGWTDIFVANFNGPNHLYWNKGDNTFQEGASTARVGETGNTFTANIGDYDRDGFLDLFTISRDIPDALYKNDGNNNNWLHVDLIGTTSNSNAIGARVQVVANQLSIFREINGGNGYGGETFTAEFGVESATNIDLLNIKWPSGREDTFDNLTVNQNIRIIEGQGKYHPIQPTTFTHTFPQSVAISTPFSATARVEPQLFESDAKIVQVALIGLGDDRTLTLKKIDNSAYTLNADDLYLSGIEETRLLAFKVVQETSIGMHTTTLPFTMILTAQILPKIQISQPSINVGEIEVGQPATTKTTINNEGPGALLITHISSDLNSLQISDTTIPVQPDSSNTLQITIVPTTSGPFSGQLTLHTTDPESETVTIAIEGIGIITPADPRADFDSNGTVNFSDFILFVAAFGGTDSTFDINSNGTVDFGDFLIFTGSFGKTITP